MSEQNNVRVSICMPHWQVKELISLSLRSIRKYTKNIPIEVIVVDNGSKDESLDYLRGLSWIKLIERGEQTPKNWVNAFQTALDIGMRESKGEYFLIMHTDTIIKHSCWLESMLEPFENEEIGAVGGWKLELKSRFYMLLKEMTDVKKAKLWLRRVLLGDENARQLKRELCPRDYCALYRAAPMREHNLTFTENNRWFGYTAGEQMYYQLKEHNYSGYVIPTSEMMKYMVHLGHATAGMRPAERKLNHWRTQKRVESKIKKFFNQEWVRQLQGDSSLDNQRFEYILS